MISDLLMRSCIRPLSNFSVKIHGMTFAKAYSQIYTAPDNAALRAAATKEHLSEAMRRTGHAA